MWGKGCGLEVGNPLHADPSRTCTSKNNCPDNAMVIDFNDPGNKSVFFSSFENPSQGGHSEMTPTIPALITLDRGTMTPTGV